MRPPPSTPAPRCASSPLCPDDAGRTSFIVAHRLSIRQADVILVMQDGHVEQKGSHEALLAKGRILRRPTTTSLKAWRNNGAGLYAPQKWMRPFGRIHFFISDILFQHRLFRRRGQGRVYCTKAAAALLPSGGAVSAGRWPQMSFALDHGGPGGQRCVHSSSRRPQSLLLCHQQKAGRLRSFPSASWCSKCGTAPRLLPCTGTG